MGDSKTSATLLSRLRDIGNQDAWEEFIENYTPRIFAWCRRYRLQDSDAADVTQDVLSKLIRAMQTFEYNTNRGSFRGWLKTVTNNTIRDMLSASARPGRGVGDTQANARLQLIQDEDALNDLANVIEEEAEREILREAEERVRLRVKPETWRAYEMTVKQAIKAPEAAEKSGMSVSDIYVSKSRVIKMVREEAEKLNRDPLSRD